MDQRTNRMLFVLLSSAVCGTKLIENERKGYSIELLQELLEVSFDHDVAHLLALGLKQNELIAKENADIEKCIFQAFYRCERINYEYVNICNTLEKARVPFLPLKGSVIRKYYPEPWMRTSCDIDVLVQKDDLSRAVACLVDELKYEVHGQFTHDVSLFSKSNVHVELHFDLIEDTVSQAAAEILGNVWDEAHLKEGHQYHFEMPDEMLYFYHIAHMAKHFENGGCGIRPFIDLWLLDNIEGADYTKRDELLSKGGLLKFANAARRLSKVWLGDADMDAVSQQMEDYILRGGIYGTNENRIIVQQQKKGGSIKYALSKIFIPYDIIKFHYPVLQKHRWLTPIMEMRRWCKLIFCGHLKRTVKELKYNSKITDADATDIQIFLNNIGL